MVKIKLFYLQNGKLIKALNLIKRKNITQIEKSSIKKRRCLHVLHMYAKFLQPEARICKLLQKLEDFHTLTIHL